MWTECNQAYLKCWGAADNARPERATAPSPGQAKRHPGLRIAIALTPCKGKSIQCWIIYLKLLPLQGVTNERALTQGVASLALGYVLLPLQGVLAKSETWVKMFLKTSKRFNFLSLKFLCHHFFPLCKGISHHIGKTNKGDYKCYRHTRSICYHTH